MARCSLLGVLPRTPPDQRQDSAVTYVALCVVSAIAVKKRFFNYRATLRVACRSGRSASSLWRSASHSGSARSVMLVYGSRHLFASRRPTCAPSMGAILEVKVLS
ncbi:hypothetical protein B1F85_12340 [Pseudomonas syringae pv. actinidiae]|nr:hypothetical protein B1R35_23570 [Pseudomonas syringae pv. actinidiae]AQX64752.1 hypothetical protein B1F85_12340 [Pseudomonas syringae pv. actinidiae]